MCIALDESERVRCCFCVSRVLPMRTLGGWSMFCIGTDKRNVCHAMVVSGGLRYNGHTQRKREEGMLAAGLLHMEREYTSRFFVRQIVKITGACSPTGGAHRLFDAAVLVTFRCICWRGGMLSWSWVEHCRHVQTTGGIGL